MVPALFITADKDNESGNKTGTKLRAELSLGNAVPACCRILRARVHARTHSCRRRRERKREREGGGERGDLGCCAPKLHYAVWPLDGQLEELLRLGCFPAL